jgi:hypothetical protein
MLSVHAPGALTRTDAYVPDATKLWPVGPDPERSSLWDAPVSANRPPDVVQCTTDVRFRVSFPSSRFPAPDQVRAGPTVARDAGVGTVAAGADDVLVAVDFAELDCLADFPGPVEPAGVPEDPAAAAEV